MPHPWEFDHHFLPRGQEIRQKILPGWPGFARLKNFSRGCPGGCTQLELTETLYFQYPKKQYNKIEKQNSIRINIVGYEEGQPFPIHISEEKLEEQMNLLLITKDEKRHYVLMKDFNEFMHNQSKHEERKHFCMYCLQCFSSESILAEHTNNCLTINGKQAIKMRKKDDNILKFNNFHKQQPVPFVIYPNFQTRKNHTPMLIRLMMTAVIHTN